MRHPAAVLRNPAAVLRNPAAVLRTPAALLRRQRATSVVPLTCSSADQKCTGFQLACSAAPSACSVDRSLELALHNADSSARDGYFFARTHHTNSRRGCTFARSLPTAPITRSAVDEMLRFKADDLLTARDLMRDRERNLLAKIHRRRSELMAMADALSAEQLTFRPAPEAWSALDVIEHLVKVEEAIAYHTKPRSPRTLLETAQTRGKLGIMRLLFAVGWRIRIPIQGILPLGGVTLTDLARRWETAQALLAERLEQFGPDDWTRPMMKHPIIGRLTPPESLRFIYWHEGHHRRQLGRIRRAVGFPR